MTYPIFQKKGGWPYPGTVPPISTLADVFTKKDTGLLIGFTAWLLAAGTQEQNDAFNFYVVNPSEIDKIDPTMADAIEEHFVDYFWATELTKYQVPLSPDDVLKPTLDGQLEVSTPVRYWSADLTSFATIDDFQNYKPAGQLQPRLGYDRYYNEKKENWEFIASLSFPVATEEEASPDLSTVRYWSDDLTSFSTIDAINNYVPAGSVQPRLHHDRYYNYTTQNWEFITGLNPGGIPKLAEEYDPAAAKRTTLRPQDASDLIAKLPAIKKAVAYTAVRAKRRKELLADRPARKLMAEAMGQTTGASLKGEQYSMKGASSIVAKSIEDSIKESTASAVLDAVEKISDGVRYTIMLPKDTYTDGVNGFLRYFGQSGWQNTKFANNWKEPLGSGYRGVNTKWKVSLTINDAPATEIVEVQFHTEESYHAKEEGTHQIKEEIRILGNRIADNEKLLATAVGAEHDRLTESSKTDKAELTEKTEAQRAIFDAMADQFNPPGSDTIALG